MISFEVIQLEFRDLTKDELGRWIDLAFVRAEGPPGASAVSFPGWRRAGRPAAPRPSDNGRY
jgi:hypothetical protein